MERGWGNTGQVLGLAGDTRKEVHGPSGAARLAHGLARPGVWHSWLKRCFQELYVVDGRVATYGATLVDPAAGGRGGGGGLHTALQLNEAKHR